MRNFFRVAVVALMSMLFACVGLAGEGKPHHLAIHVDQNDPLVMNQVLNNATNVIEYYRAKNEDVDVDIVTYGPGLHMLRADTSPVQDRLKRQTRDGKDRRPCHLDRAGRHHRTIRRGSPDGIAGTGLELRPPVMW